MTARYAPLVPFDEVASPRSYRQLRRQREDDSFRCDIEAVIRHACRDEENGPVLLATFLALTRELATEGALSFTGLVPPARFDGARRAYDSAISAKGSRGSLHNYLNVADCDFLLDDPHFREVFTHPLLVALVAHALGAPMKIIDLRAKDTHPVDVVARDNTLHVDNSPFMDEFKVIVAWTLGTGLGPSGQGLTYLPRTNRLLRQCYLAPDGEAWSDEDSCIFPSGARVDEALAAQARLFDDRLPRVVHLKDMAAPCHTIFAASRLVHHRYRTSAGGARSAIMASFHRIDDGTGFLGVGDVAGGDLDRFLLTGGGDRSFLSLLTDQGASIVAALRAAATWPGLVVDPDRHLLRGAALRAWYARQSGGVSLNQLRSATLARFAGQESSAAGRLVLRMQYDLQGALNMPLYVDLREETRKRARIVVREMRPEHILGIVTQQDPDLILRDAGAGSHRGLGELTDQLCSGLLALERLMSTARVSGSAGPVWGSTDGRAAAVSLHRFVVDLGVAARRVADSDSLVTAAVFGALAAALAGDLFDLGDRGPALTAELFGMYADLVAPSLRDRESGAP
ncbi:hypothetical protein OG559_00200 [Micromonospora sp. NBC_01405]|uniref:hypothetical protein n=1 Tax=Micromonospora sp. NBC_01405 TaxID=2903589 RepID=UPI0032450E97